MTRSKSIEKAITEPKIVETANSLNYAEFVERFFSLALSSRLSDEISYQTDREIRSELYFAKDLTLNKHVLESCFSLIQDSSAADYKASEIRWSAASKRKEMILPDMRYLILRENTETSTTTPTSMDTIKSVLGFISFMITYEDGLEVLYVYEVHLCKDLRAQGVGTLLLNTVEQIGRAVGLRKCMLTVFRSNKKAVKWYDRCGYSVDAFSPGSRVLRNGSIKEPSYVILSKPLSQLDTPKSS